MQSLKYSIILLVSLTSLYSQRILKSELNPEYQQYLIKKNNNQFKQITKSGKFLGHIPAPVKMQTELKSPVLNKPKSFDVRYDLRDYGYVSSVKNQGNCGACWTFATIGAIESNWLKRGEGEYDLSENNMKNRHGFEWSACSGGNSYIATSYMNRGNGPALEVDDPYLDYEDGSIENYDPVQYMGEARFLPNDPELIKQAILEHGALYTNMRWEDRYYNSTNHTYFCDASVDYSTNHGVLLVGWDNNKVTDGGIGAWIIKNSWGTTWGEDGYFYISYNDTKVNGSVSYWPDKYPYLETVKVGGYDEIGWVTSLGFTNSNGLNYGLMKYTPENETIAMVGTWAIAAESYLKVEVYDNFNGTTLSDKLTESSNYYCQYAGYYSIPLLTQLSLTANDDVYIKVKYETSTNYPIPAESYSEGYADPVIESDRYWISPSGSSWTSANVLDIDLNIKVYSTYSSNTVTADFNASTTSGDAPLTVNFTDQSTGNPNTWLWNFGDGGTSTLQNPVHVYEEPGFYTVTLNISNDYNQNTVIKTDYINVRQMGNVIDTLLYESFEGEVEGWSYIDNDGDDNHWRLYEEDDTYDVSHTGSIGAGIYYNSSGNDDWFVTPQVELPANSEITFSFWARSHDTSYLEDFNVMLSAGSQTISDFTVSLDEVRDVLTEWSQYSYDLSDYSGETVYLAIHCVSVDKWYLFADDFYLQIIDNTTTDITLNIENRQSSPSNNVIIPIISESGFSNVAIIDLHVSYDPDLLTYTGMNSDYGLASGDVTASNGQVNIVWVYSGTTMSVPDGESLIDLQFQVDGSASIGETCNIAFTGSNNIGDADENVFSIDLNDGLFTVIEPGYNISGKVIYCESEIPLENDTVVISGDESHSIITNSEGEYFFEGIKEGNITLSPDKEGGTTLNGAINGFDLLRLKNYLLGNKELSDFALKSGDCTGDGNVNGFDLLRLKRYLLDYDVDPPIGTWSFSPEQYAFNPLSSDMTDQDFNAYIYGDVNLNWSSNSAPMAKRNQNTNNQINMSNYYLDENGYLHIQIDNEKDIDLAMLDWEIEFNNTFLELISVNSSILGGLEFNVDNNRLNLVWLYDNEELEISKKNVICELVFKVKKESNVHKLSFTEDNYIADKSGNPCYSEYDQVEINTALLASQGKIKVPEETHLYNNYPNPFNPTTTISYYLKEDCKVKLTVYDLQGEIVNVLKNTKQSSGFYQIEWNGMNSNNQQVPSGIYFCQFEYNGKVDVKQMVLMK